MPIWGWLIMRQSSVSQQHEEGRGLAASPLLCCPIHPSAWNKSSPKFISKILHSPAVILQESQSRAPRIAPPLELVAPMDRYTR
jgi:hypothetical protein